SEELKKSTISEISSSTSRLTTPSHSSDEKQISEFVEEEESPYVRIVRALIGEDVEEEEDITRKTPGDLAPETKEKGNSDEFPEEEQTFAMKVWGDLYNPEFDVAERNFHKCIEEHKANMELLYGKPREERPKTPLHVAEEFDEEETDINEEEKNQKSPKKTGTVKKPGKAAASKWPKKAASKSPKKAASKSPKKAASKSPKKAASKSPKKAASKSPKKAASKKPNKAASKKPKKATSKKPNKKSKKK
ncbi:hypothetical protein WDU94_007061, partial [Cyamophila willieti]